MARIEQVDDVLTLATDAIGELNRPVMLVALSGLFDIAGAATTALEEFAPSDYAITVGELDPDPFYDFTQARPYVVIENGERTIEWPENRIDVVRGHGDRDLVVMIGTEPHVQWRLYSAAVRTAAQRLGCEVVVTVGATADAVPHTRQPPVTGSTTDVDLAAALGVGAPTYQGPTGLLGVLLTDLADHRIPAVSLRVGVPHYLMNTEHPGAVLALQTHLAHVLDVPMLVTEDDDLEAIERSLARHNEIVTNDEQLAFYVGMLEREYDRKAEAAIPTADDIGAEFERFLNDQRDNPHDK